MLASTILLIQGVLSKLPWLHGKCLLTRIRLSGVVDANTPPRLDASVPETKIFNAALISACDTLSSLSMLPH